MLPDDLSVLSELLLHTHSAHSANGNFGATNKLTLKAFSQKLH